VLGLRLPSIIGKTCTYSEGELDKDRLHPTIANPFNSSKPPAETWRRVSGQANTVQSGASGTAWHGVPRLIGGSVPH